MGTAFTLYDMFDIFVTEVLERTEDRKRCTLAKSAERTRLDEFRCFFQFVKVFHLALAVCDLLKEFEHTLRSDSARTAFPAGFSLSESHEEFRNIDHTGALVHNNQTAGTDDRIVFLNLVKIKRNVQILFYETSAGRSTDLNTFEFTAALETASDIINDGTECGSHRNFDKTGIVYVTGKCECLGSRASFCTNASVPLNTIGDDHRYVGISLNVV